MLQLACAVSHMFRLPSKYALTVHIASNKQVRGPESWGKSDFSVLKRLSLPCYFLIATTLNPNKCDQTAGAEKGHKKREKKER